MLSTMKVCSLWPEVLVILQLSASVTNVTTQASCGDQNIGTKVYTYGIQPVHTETSDMWYICLRTFKKADICISQNDNWFCIFNMIKKSWATAREPGLGTKTNVLLIEIELARYMLHFFLVFTQSKQKSSQNVPYQKLTVVCMLT